MALRKLQYFLILVSVFSSALSVGQVTIPDVVVNVWTNATEPVSVMVLPDGSGMPFDQAGRFGGESIDATIYAQVLETETPIANFPAEDMWLQSRLGGLVLCMGGSVAERDTDADGITTWIASPRAGGCADPSLGDHLDVLLNGDAFDSSALGGYILVSPDLNGDLVVNLADVHYFSGDYNAAAGGSAIHRSDFHWDGFLNLSDVGRFAASMGAGCPCASAGCVSPLPGHGA
jgi:hypothetical protein